ncbi:MAG: aldose 1-epimerase [Oscillospiraceae bacterium]
MNTYITDTEYHGEKCLEMSAGGYKSLFAYELGGQMLRLYDEKNQIEVLRFDETVPMEKIRQAPVIWGWPTLYLPNRLDGGRLKTSDGEYAFPINETDLNNYIHGFLHLRRYRLVRHEIKNECVTATAQYIYDENDEMFQYFPVSFKASLTYTLSSDGLEQDFELTNLSEKALPVGAASHTAIKCPFSKGGSEAALRLKIHADKKILFGERFLNTGEIAKPDENAQRFIDGKINPLTEIIDNQMFMGCDGEINSKPFYGVEISDDKTGQKICYQVGKEYKFWLVWNEWGNKGYCCPEPMSWMINAPNIELPAEKTGYAELKRGESWCGYQRIYTEII